MNTTRIQIDLHARSPEDVQRLTESIRLLVAEPTADVQTFAVATAQQVQEARHHSGNVDVDDNAAVTYVEGEDLESDFYYVQGWVRVVDGTQPLSLGRVQLAAEDSAYWQREGFAARALTHLERLWSPGHMVDFEDLAGAVWDFGDQEPEPGNSELSDSELDNEARHIARTSPQGEAHHAHRPHPD